MAKQEQTSKKEKGGIKDFKPFRIEETRPAVTPREKVNFVSIVNALLSQYNTKIRTSKTIEITGAGRLKLPDLGSVPSTCRVGELIVSGGKLYVCSAADTFTIVGTQT